jgi:signal recognition particle subunit SRP54
MFDNLSQRLDKAWDLVRKDGKLTADNIKEPMREIRRALLEADVCPILLALAPESLYSSVCRQSPKHAVACLNISIQE